MFDKNFIKRILILAVIALALFLALFIFPKDEVVIKIEDTKILAEFADTQEERLRGLSNRESLGKNNGMLFVFDDEGRHGIWMKDMNFPIDILWIDSDFEAIDIKQDVKPESYPEVFYPYSQSKYIIEVNSGFVENNNIKIGDKIIF